MLDTIVLRLHDLNKHRLVRNHLMKIKGNYSHSVIKYLDKDEYENSSGFKTAEMIKFGDSGKTVLKNFNNKKHIKSSHYSLAYSINQEKDFIEFNFSIPKYLYGTNIAQFVTNPNSKNFFFPRDQTIEHQIASVHNRLILFLKTFFNREFSFIEPDKKIFDLNDLEIVRLDICYNQIFNTERDAMEYLNAQKLINKKFDRENSNTKTNFKTSISYKGDHFYFKIYHKGAEYASNDKHKHLKINASLNKEKQSIEEDPNWFKQNNTFFDDYESPDENDLVNTRLKEKGYSDIEIIEMKKDPNFRYNFFDTKYLQGFADRILRYEISIRNGYMSNIYKRKVFKSKNKTYRDEFKRYKNLHSKSKAGQQLTNLNTDERSFYKLFKKNLQKTHRFHPFYDRLEADDQNDFPITSDKNTAWSGVQPFTKNLMLELIKDFWKRLNDFQPKETLSVNQLLRKVEDKNESTMIKQGRWKDVKSVFERKEMKDNCGTKISKNRVTTISQLLEKFGSFDGLTRSGLYDRTTIYRWKKLFKSLGYEENAVFDFIPIYVKNDFEAYYTECSLNRRKIYHNWGVI